MLALPQFASYDRDHAMRPSFESPMNTRVSTSAGPHDVSMYSRVVAVLQTSFVDPTTSLAKPIRREVSASPPIPSLVDKPVFIKSPAAMGEFSEQRPTKTVSLGSFADFNGIVNILSSYLDILCILNYAQARSPSRNRILHGLPTIHSAPIQLQLSSNGISSFLLSSSSPF